MIAFHSLSLAWMQEVSLSLGIRDRVLLEKTIRALWLLECLVAERMDFVFKGGTALMLLLDSRRRLSIDIDIILPETPPDLPSKLAQVAARGGFLRVEEHGRARRSGLQKAHYKFWFSPSFVTNQKEDYVLLDIVFEPVRYLQLQQLPIASALLAQDGAPLRVTVPSAEDILGDKLTAFAPATTGIPYFKNGDSKSMEIAKQLFDIGCLYDVVHDLGRVKSAFLRFAQAELIYRGMQEHGAEVVLQDILETAFCISMRGLHTPGNFAELQAGIQRVRSFIFSEPYHLEKAIVQAGKAAFLVNAMLHGSASLARFELGLPLGDGLIADPARNKLNKLKKSNVEAFYFWRAALSFPAHALRTQVA
jgi:predicted nucleotidyltransferase component of viral defense system